MSRRRTRALLPITGCALIASALAAGPSMAATSHQPVVASVSPASGPLAGGTKITIHGMHLRQTKAVMVGGSPATHVHVVSASTVTARAPHHPAGNVHVRVEGADRAKSDPSAADRFAYIHAPSVSSVRLTHGNGRTGSTVSITGRHLAGATSVRFGSTPATVTAVRGGAITVTVPKHKPGLLHVTVSTAGGASARRADDEYPMPSYTHQHWTRAGVGDVSRNELAQITCPTPNHCIAIDHSQWATTIDDGVWGAPAFLPPGEKSGALPDRISCPTADFCVVVGRTHLFMLQDGSWTVGPDITDPSGGGINGIACPTVTFCMLTQASSYRTYEDGIWSDPVSGYGFSDVACWAVNQCIAAGSPAYRFDGTTWTPMDGYPTGGYGAEQISCASGSLCAVVTQQRELTVWDGLSWTPFQKLSGHSLWSYTDLNCIATTCYYQTDAGTYAYAAGSWARTDDSSYVLLGCATATNCFGEDELGHIGRFDGSTWHSTSVQLARAGGATSLSCTSASFCALSDWAGNAYTSDGSAWSDPVRIADTAREDSTVSCTKPTFCLAAFGNDTVASYDGTAWSSEASTVRPESTLACFSAHDCLASGPRDTEHFDGTSWTVVATGGPWLSMSCVDATFCAATTPNAVQFWDGDNWLTTLEDPDMPYTNPHGISCPTRNFCLVIDGAGEMYTYRDGSWGDPEPTLWHERLAVSCYSATFCETVSEYGQQTYDGQNWATVIGSGDDIEHLLAANAMDCFGVGTCTVISGGSGYTSEPS